MTCREYQEQISAYIDGELDMLERQPLEDHILRCPACLRGFDAFRRVRDVVSATPRIKPPAGTSQRIMAHVRAHAPAGRHPLLRVRPWPVAAAAGFLAALAAWLLVDWSDRPVQPPPVAVEPAPERPASPHQPATASAPKGPTPPAADPAPTSIALTEPPELMDPTVLAEGPRIEPSVVTAQTAEPARTPAAVELPEEMRPDGYASKHEDAEEMLPDGAIAEAPRARDDLEEIPTDREKRRPPLTPLRDLIQTDERLFAIQTEHPEKVATEFIRFKYGDTEPQIRKNARVTVTIDVTDDSEKQLRNLLSKYGAKQIDGTTTAALQTKERPARPAQKDPEPRVPGRGEVVQFDERGKGVRVQNTVPAEVVTPQGAVPAELFIPKSRPKKIKVKDPPPPPPRSVRYVIVIEPQPDTGDRVRK